MKPGDFVQWNITQFHGSMDFTPLRGWIVATEGDWAVVRVSSMRHPQAPFATFNKRDLVPVPTKELVRGGAVLLT